MSFVSDVEFIQDRGRRVHRYCAGDPSPFAEELRAALLTLDRNLHTLKTEVDPKRLDLFWVQRLYHSLETVARTLVSLESKFKPVEGVKRIQRIFGQAIFPSRLRETINRIKAESDVLR
jgi:hypothetical protein